MKVVKRIFECIIWQQIDIGNMQFGFMKGKGITDAIFIVRQMQENFRAKATNLYFDRVPRVLTRWAMLLIGFREKG